MHLAPLAAASLAWNRLALQWTQTMLASGQAIAIRTGRSNTPVQLFDMVGEKVLASVESSNAMTRRMLAFPSSGPVAMWAAWMQLLSSGLTPYRVRAVRNARSRR